MAIIAVTGLRAEARIARRAGFSVVCGGGNPTLTAAALARAIAGGRPDLLVSFGIAGGLAPGLAPGTLILASAVIAVNGGRHLADETARRQLRGRLGAVEGDLLGGNAIVVGCAEKAALHARTAALAVDLESAVVALAAAAAGLPFLVLRAIADPAERGLPAAARIKLKPDGTPDLGRILASLLLEPRQIGALTRLADDTRRALRALTHAAAAARPLLAELGRSTA
jgi:adenosylhomocysteine nucleosidase